MENQPTVEVTGVYLADLYDVQLPITESPVNYYRTMSFSSNRPGVIKELNH
jgi:hypothetical protein